MGEEAKKQEFHLKNGRPLSDSSCTAGIGVYIHPLGTFKSVGKNRRGSMAVPLVETSICFMAMRHAERGREAI